MRLTSCLTCGIKPLWEATWPRIVQRRADREAAAAEAAAAVAAQEALVRAQAALRADNIERLIDRECQMSWHEAMSRSTPPRPPTPPVLSRPAIHPVLSPPSSRQH